MKKVISVLCAIMLTVTSLLSSFTAFAGTSIPISTATDLTNAFSDTADNEYYLTKDLFIRASEIKSNTLIDGKGYTLTSKESSNSAVISQNINCSSVFKNVNIKGNTKPEIGIWLGSGLMTFTDCKIYGFSITSLRECAIDACWGTLTLNNTAFENNTPYDIKLEGNGVVNINSGTSLNNLCINSIYSRLNIGDNWEGEFCLTFENPYPRVIGTVSDSADISRISVTNEGYILTENNGKLLLESVNGETLHFDMSQIEELYKGSTGFLYGSAEINVPSIDLLQGLQPNTMVQKAVGGLQHPTGDAVRTKSSLLSSGVKDMQIYFQDMYLEWPYDAPMKDGSIDIDSYQKSVEEILYTMICDKADVSDDKAFLGTDGNYYILNKENASHYSYVLFNEPDQIWFGWNLSGLEQAWKQLYIAVHNIDPNARCVGPNYSGYNQNDYNDFLSYCKDNDCLPEIISWHELGDISMTDFFVHYDQIQGFVNEYYKDSGIEPELMVNEYARHYDIGSPGGLVKWLAMFEDKDMCGCMAYWAMANSLNELASDQNSPSSSWWVYHWYAQMTGKQCPLTSPDFDETRFYGVTSYDEDINMGYALFGGSEVISATETVMLDNINSTQLCNNDMVNVKLYAVGFSGQHGANYSPECIFDGAVEVIDNTLSISVNDTDEMDAYFAVLTKPDDDSSASDSLDIHISTKSYEAEDAKLIGGATAYAKLDWTAFATSGRYNVGSINNIGDAVEFTVFADSDGVYNVSLFYSLQAPFVNPQTLEPDNNGQNRGIGQKLPYGVYLDGQRLDDIYLDTTITWAYKNHCDIDMTLTKGEHKITFEHINGNDGDKGNLQLTASIDKLDLTKLDVDNRYNFEINLNEMTSFKSADTYRVTAVASKEGYYNITTDKDVTLFKQCVDYAPDAKSFSEVSTYDAPIDNTVYLSKGANTIAVKGECNKLIFTYDALKTEQGSTVITADDMTLFGQNPAYKSNDYAISQKVITNISTGQGEEVTSPESNYILFKVNAESDGLYNFAIRYANDEPAPVMLKSDGTTYIHPYNIDLVERYAQIVVNDSEPETVYFRNTMSWDTFKTVDVQLELKEGENVIKLYNDNSYQFSQLVNSTAPELDTITVSSLSYNGLSVDMLEKECTDHRFTTSIFEPTCTQDGYTLYSCIRCDYSYVSDVVEKTGHSFGENEKVCSLCGEPNPDYKEPTTTTTTTTTTTNTTTTTTTEPAINTEPSTQTTTQQAVTEPTTQPVLVTTTIPTTQASPTGATKVGSEWIASKQKNTKIKKLTKAKKSFKATWSKVSGVTGYQVQYATDKNFKKNKKTVTISKNKTTSTTVKKLKAKQKYYVRIRTYKNVKLNGKTVKVYSKWSSAKTVTTK